MIGDHPHNPIDERIVHAIRAGGYPALFGILVCCGLGLPLPEDIPLITAGILVQQGHFNLAFAAVCAWCGIIGGDCILYSLGRKFGSDVTKIPVIGRHINVKRIKRVEIWFEHYGIWVVAVGRMFAGIRGVMVVVAGTSKFKFWKFIVADGLAAIVSGGLFLFLGYKFAENMHRLHEIVKNIKGGMMIGLVILGAGLIGYLIWRRHIRRKSEGPGFPIETIGKVDVRPSSGTGGPPTSGDLRADGR